MNTSDKLRNLDIKVTKPRITIYDILQKEDKGLNAEDIYNLCKKEDLYINLSTVYRTLDLFENKNIIRKYDLGDNKYNYSFNQDDHHHTLECESCLKKLDLDCPMQQIEDLISKDTGFKLTDHKLELKGICRECLEKLNEKEKKF